MLLNPFNDSFVIRPMPVFVCVCVYLLYISRVIAKQNCYDSPLYLAVSSAFGRISWRSYLTRSELIICLTAPRWLKRKKAQQKRNYIHKTHSYISIYVYVVYRYICIMYIIRLWSVGRRHSNIGVSGSFYTYLKIRVVICKPTYFMCRWHLCAVKVLIRRAKCFLAI